MSSELLKSELIALVDSFKERGLTVSRISTGNIEVHFFPEKPAPMALDPVSLSKTLADSMPPDTQMLFASSEDMPETPTPQQRETDAMT